MKRTIYTLLATVILSIFSFPVFGQAGTISFNQSCSPGFSQQWPIDIKEAKNIRFTYSTDINSSGDVLVILELAADGVSYTLVQPSPVYGYGTGTICTNLKKGKGLVTFQTANSGSGSGTKKFDLKYEADNPINTTSDLNVGGNGTITGALTVKSTFTASSATASNSIIGKLGIGTTTPKAKLESVTGVNAYPATSNTTQSGAALRLRGGDNAVLDFGMNSINTWIQATDQTSLGLNYNISLNPNGGNVGIGTTTTPIATLDVNGSMHVNGDINAYNVLTFQDKSFRFDVPSTIIPNLRTTPFSMPIYGIASPLVTGSADLWLSGYNAIRMFTASNPIPRLSILYNGYVGIGSSNPVIN